MIDNFDKQDVITYLFWRLHERGTNYLITTMLVPTPRWHDGQETTYRGSYELNDYFDNFVRRFFETM